MEGLEQTIVRMLVVGQLSSEYHSAMPLTPELIEQSALDAVFNVDGAGVNISRWGDPTYMGRELPPGRWFVVSHGAGAIGMVLVEDAGEVFAFQEQNIPDGHRVPAVDFDAAVHLVVNEAFPQRPTR